MTVLHKCIQLLNSFYKHKVVTGPVVDQPALATVNIALSCTQTFQYRLVPFVPGFRSCFL